jgi:hypothetical protein
VDRLPGRALQMARLEAAAGVTSIYFFRHKRISFRPSVVRAIAEMGHAIGYHYEELADARGDYDKAWKRFREHISKLRAFAPVDTIAMHGRPFSAIDNRDLWRAHDYREAGVTAEVYLDLDYRSLRYFTDTGGCWNHPANLRDLPPSYKRSAEEQSLRSTSQLVAYLERHPQVDAVVSCHPERWAEQGLGWVHARLTDAAANAAKQGLKGWRHMARP